MRLFLGIDGGGTRTTAWLANRDGSVLGKGEAGPSNPLKVGMVRSQREILLAYRAAFRDARLAPGFVDAGGPSSLDAVCAGISGVDRKVVQQPLLAWMRRGIRARRHVLTTDAAITLAAACRAAPGVIVIAGTGSIAYARDKQGKLLRAGGWGLPYDDCGSGYDLGLKAVSAALRAYDGRGPKTRLLDGVCRHFRLRNITEVVALQPDQLKVAGLFPVVSKAAEAGDRVARELCKDAALDLSRLTFALLRRAGWTRASISVVTSGGVFMSSPLIRRLFARHLHESAPKARVKLLDLPPVEGAIWLALQAGNKKS